MNELHLFAGAGGGILGGMLLGHTTVCAVEIEPYARKVLLQRQRDGILPRFPIWDDIRTFDAKPWRGIADVVCGGFPCKGISAIGDRSGLEHAESGLWTEQARIIGEILPRYAFVENSPGLLSNGGLRVVADLAAMGYGMRWGVMGADNAGADHERKRVWILADAKMQPGLHKPNFRESAKGLLNHRSPWKANPWDEAIPRVYRVDDGLAHRLDRHTAIGNGQVPSVVTLAWRILAQDTP